MSSDGEKWWQIKFRYNKKDKETDNWLINNTENRTLLIGWVRDR